MSKNIRQKIVYYSTGKWLSEHRCHQVTQNLQTQVNDGSGWSKSKLHGNKILALGYFRGNKFIPTETR